MGLNHIDSHFMYVQGRVKALNPNRKFIGVMDALDWPPDRVEMESFYLLTFRESPIGKTGYSPSQPITRVSLTWAAVIIGSDVASGQTGSNRGDRYRTKEQMLEELRHGVFPLFAEAKQWSVSAGGGLVGTSLSPASMMWWTPLDYTPRFPENQDGTLVISASTTLTGYETPIVS